MIKVIVFCLVGIALAKVPTSEFCFKIPFAKPSMCTRDVNTQEAYKCEGEDFVRSCSVQLSDVETTCFRNETRRETYECMKDVEEDVCGKVADIKHNTCYREVTIPNPGCKESSNTSHLRESSRSCRLETETLPSTCTRSANRTEEYNCIKTEPHKVCKPAPLLNNINTSKNNNNLLCSRTVLPTISRLCKRKPQCKKTKKLCSRKVSELTKYPCKTRPSTCTYREETVNDICTKEVTSRETYKCPSGPSKLQKQCPEVPIEVPSICTKKKLSRQEYECDGETFYGNPHLRTPMVFQGAKRCMKEIPLLETYPCTKTVMMKQCSSKKSPLFEECSRMVTKEEEYPCQTTRQVKHCKLEENLTGELCETEQENLEEFECDSFDGKCLREDEEDTDYESCVQAGAVEEKFACGSELSSSAEICSLQFVPVETTCEKTIPWVEEYPCTRTIKKKNCEDKSSFDVDIRDRNSGESDGCGVLMKKKESYICASVEYKQQCERITKKVPGTCHIDVPVSEPYTCIKQMPNNVCTSKAVPRADTCYRDVIKQEEYKCFELCHKKSCKTYPAGVTPIHVSALNNAATTNSSSLTKKLKLNKKPFVFPPVPMIEQGSLKQRPFPSIEKKTLKFGF